MQNLVINEKEQRHFFQWKKPTSKIEVFYKDTLLASTTNAILLKEVGKEVYDGVYYIPMEDIQKEVLMDSDTSTHCPIKGDASYFTFQQDGTQVKDIAWYYPDPIKRSKIIKNHVAFYADKLKFVIEPLPKANGMNV